MGGHVGCELNGWALPQLRATQTPHTYQQKLVTEVVLGHELIGLPVCTDHVVSFIFESGRERAGRGAKV